MRSHTNTFLPKITKIVRRAWTAAKVLTSVSECLDMVEAWKGNLKPTLLSKNSCIC